MTGKCDSLCSLLYDRFVCLVKRFVSPSPAGLVTETASVRTPPISKDHEFAVQSTNNQLFPLPFFMLLELNGF